MSRITEELDVGVPVRTAYDQWTQFESFPQFMDGVDEVVQVNDTILDWTATIAGVRKQWRAKVVEQRPDQVVAWKSIDGVRNDGSVRFQKLSTNRTRLALTLDVDVDGPLEKAGVALGVVERQVKGDLERFRDFIEARGRESGGWRGSVHAGEEQRQPRS